MARWNELRWESLIEQNFLSSCHNKRQKCIREICALRIVHFHFHLEEFPSYSSNGWKCTGDGETETEFYYIWSSPIFIVVIGWEMIESSCVTSCVPRKKSKDETSVRHEIEAFYFDWTLVERLFGKLLSSASVLGLIANKFNEFLLVINN